MKPVLAREGLRAAGRTARKRLLWCLGLLALLLARPAEADVLCTLFSYCRYEGVAFTIRVVDQNGQPLAGVHALAEWLDRQHATPHMAEDAVSGPDGVLAFPAWGPLRGSPVGLIPGEDPVITLFKPGYVYVPAVRTMHPYAIVSTPPPGTEERTRVRRYGDAGQTVTMAPFRGSAEDWVQVLQNATMASSGIPTEDLLRLRVPYLNRWRRLLAEKDHLPAEYQKPGQTFWHLQRMITNTEEGRP
jgi:hypothetical protein